MIKKKFNKGDLVWANLRGYGVVLSIGRRGEDHGHDLMGVCDYADIRWQDNLHFTYAKFHNFRIGHQPIKVGNKTIENS